MGHPFCSRSNSGTIGLRVIFSKKQWILSKRYGYLTPSEMVSDYFKSNILRILIVIIALGFSIPFIAMQLSFGGLVLNIISDNVIGKGSASILIGAVVCVYLSAGGIRSLMIIDSIQFLLIIFGICFLGAFWPHFQLNSLIEQCSKKCICDFPQCF